MKSRNTEPLVTTLAAAGYFGNAEAERAAVLAGDVEALWQVPRCAHGVADPLNRFDLEAAMERCQSALEAIGVHARTSAKALEDSKDSAEDAGDSTVAVQALLGHLDALCEEAKVPERAYFVDVLDGIVAFLTNEMLRAFQATDLLPEWEKPWRDQPPERPPPRGIDALGFRGTDCALPGARRGSIRVRAGRGDAARLAARDRALLNFLGNDRSVGVNGPNAMTAAQKPEDTASLLAADEPPPFEVVGGRRSSPYLIQCDHASNRIPRALGTLGLSERELERHIAWDIGAAGVARHLGRALDAWLILQNYSRLVIDCNRPLEHADSIARRSEDTLVPGNRDVLPLDAERRARSVFEPYHARIARELDERAAARAIMIFLHSFTPTFRGVSRPWQAGVLFHRDRRLSDPVLEALRREPGLVVGENEPYAASALTDYGLVEHAERRGLLHVELEIRQDLIERDSDQLAWAERLARVFRVAVASTGR